MLPRWFAGASSSLASVSEHEPPPLCLPSSRRSAWTLCIMLSWGPRLGPEGLGRNEQREGPGWTPGPFVPKAPRHWCLSVLAAAWSPPVASRFRPWPKGHRLVYQNYRPKPPPCWLPSTPTAWFPFNWELSPQPPPMFTSTFCFLLRFLLRILYQTAGARGRIPCFFRTLFSFTFFSLLFSFFCTAY